jgi:hypothetical protein
MGDPSLAMSARLQRRRALNRSDLLDRPRSEGRAAAPRRPCVLVCQAPDRQGEEPGLNFSGWREEREGLAVIKQRRRVKHVATFEERLAQEAIKEAAEKQPEGSKARELLLRRARQAETASRINRWLSSPGLQPPRALESLLADQQK